MHALADGSWNTWIKEIHCTFFSSVTYSVSSVPSFLVFLIMTFLQNLSLLLDAIDE